MNYEYYQRRLKDLEADILQLKFDYIHANQPCALGTQAILTDQKGKSTKVYVQGFKIGFNGTIETVWCRIKNDGSRSLDVRHVYSNDKISYI